MRSSDWSSDVCYSDLRDRILRQDDIEVRNHRERRGDDLVAVADADGIERRGQGRRDRTSVVSGKSVSVRVDLGGLSSIKKTNPNHKTITHLHSSLTSRLINSPLHHDITYALII